jgi:hypothetical protein
MMIKKALSKLVIALCLTAILLCCNNQDDDMETEAPRYQTFVEYSFWAEEEKGFVTGLFQFRMNGDENTPSRLAPSAKVELDGEIVGGDSAGISGSFYEIHKPLDEFAGEHTIVFTTEDKRKLSEQFTFSPFTLVTANDTLMTRNEMLLQFEGLKDGETVRIVMTDTSFRSNGINSVETIENNAVDMRPLLADNIKNGPVILQVFKEDERMIRGNSSVSGRISITYSLKKEFELVD